MEEPVRLVCPQCELVYRLKRFTSGRTYTCKGCGAPLRHVALPPAGVAPVASGRGVPPAGAAPESDLSRLPRLIEQLTQHLDAIKELGAAEPDENSPAARLLDIAGRLEGNLRDITFDLNRKFMELDDKVTTLLGPSLQESTSSLDHKIETLDAKVTGSLEDNLRRFTGGLGERLQEFAGGLEQKLGTLDEKVAAVSEQIETASGKADAPVETLAALQKEMRATHQTFLERLEEHRAAQKIELNSLLAPIREEAAGGTTVEVDIDELADRLVAGVRGHGSLYDPEAGSVVDAMARLADELVKEQQANTARLDKLAEELRQAVSGISKLDEWRGELPERVADEIGATVEARVVGPISGALARQAPSILAELQDSKLVDIVSRSVREAQRPLLREILSGGRNGVPVWLFASVLLPLLLILGYLFLPGEAGIGTQGGSMAEMASRLAGVETSLGVDVEERLHNIEVVTLDLKDKAYEHAMNAATLKERAEELAHRLGEREKQIAERDKRIAEYAAMLEKQAQRLETYRMRLVQLGVVTDVIPGQ